MPAEELKIWLAIRRDLAIPAGKLAVQSGHAFFQLAINCTNDVSTDKFYEYVMNTSGTPKIAVMVRNEAELLRVGTECKAAGIAFASIRDAGRTVFSGPTHTVCAFGPTYRSSLPPFLKRLRLYED